MRRVRLGAAALAALAVAGCFAGAAAGHDEPTICVGQLSGVTVERLLVPAGQTCTVADVTVHQGVRVRRGATLVATNISVGDSIRVRSGGSLQIAGMTNDVGATSSPTLPCESVCRARA